MTGSSAMMNPCAEAFSGTTVTHDVRQRVRVISIVL